MLQDTVVIDYRYTTEDGVLYNFDVVRNKWLSDSRVITFGISSKNITIDRWMSIGDVLSYYSGYRMIREATIIGMSVQTNSNTDCTCALRKNGNVANIATLPLSSTDGGYVDTIDVDLNQGDWLQAILLANTLNVNYPVLSVEVCWRKT